MVQSERILPDNFTVDRYKMVLFGYMEAEQRQWFLGVPGVFSNQEQLMAGIFGFPEFRTKQMTRQKTGEFGYWYRFIEI